MENLNLIDLPRSEIVETKGGFKILGPILIFDTIDFIDAFIEGFDEAWSEKCDCECNN